MSKKSKYRKNVKYVSTLVIQKATFIYVGLSVCVWVCIHGYQGDQILDCCTDYWGPSGDEDKQGEEKGRALLKGKNKNKKSLYADIVIDHICAYKWNDIWYSLIYSAYK